MDDFHAALPLKAWSCVSQSSAENGNTIINATRISVQNFLCDECPAIDLLGDGCRNGSTSLVREMNVPGFSGGWGQLWRDVDALV